MLHDIEAQRQAVADIIRRKVVNERLKDRETHLMQFARSKLWYFKKSEQALQACVENVKALLDAGAKLDAKDSSGSTALLHATRSAGAPEVIDLLLSRGADPNIPNEKGFTALHFAVEPTICNSREPTPLDRVSCCRRGLARRNLVVSLRSVSPATGP